MYTDAFWGPKELENCRFAKEYHMPEVYHGDGPYIFISYKHEDAEIVMMEIEQLQKKGINVWYDAGLALGEPWDEVEVKNHIDIRLQSF